MPHRRITATNGDRLLCTERAALRRAHERGCWVVHNETRDDYVGVITSNHSGDWYAWLVNGPPQRCDTMSEAVHALADEGTER